MDEALTAVCDQARRYPRRVALLAAEGPGATYRDLARRIDALAPAAARAHRRVVAVPCDFGLDAVATFLAVHRAGGAPMFVGPDQPPGTSGPGIGWAQVGPAGDLDVIAPEGDPLPWIPDTGYVARSSGTTGAPKLVPVQTAALDLALRQGIDAVGGAEGGRWAELGPAGHDMPTVDLLLALVGGATFVALQGRRWRLAPAAAIERSEITHWRCVPRFLELVAPRSLDAGCLRGLALLATGGDALRADVAARVGAAVGGTGRLLATYGTSETPGFVSVLDVDDHPPEGWVHGVAPLGRALPGWTLRADGDGPGTELVVEGRGLPPRYLRAEPADHGRLVAGEAGDRLRTGDRCAPDGHGLAVVGRIGRMAKRSGEWFDLAALDRAATAGLGVAAASTSVGGRIVLFVEAGCRPDGSDGVAVARRLRQVRRLDEMPDEVRVVAALPRTASGKVRLDHLEREPGPPAGAAR